MANAKINSIAPINNPKIFVISGGFYYFGDEIPAPEGYIQLARFAMFGGFAGGKGLPGVCRGDSQASVTLDRFGEDQTGLFHINSCLGILDCIDLYQFKGTTLR